MMKQLLFVYNANSGLFSTVTDFAHKIFSPATYQCQLCALTYGNILMKQAWKSFIESLPVKIVFLHKDEFEKQYKTAVVLPAVFVSLNGTIQEIISKHEIAGCNSIEVLKTLVVKKLQPYV